MNWLKYISAVVFPAPKYTAVRGDKNLEEIMSGVGGYVSEKEHEKRLRGFLTYKF